MADLESNNSNRQLKELSTKTRRRIAILAVIGGVVLGGSYLSFLIYWSWQTDSWMLNIVRNHFAATVGAPCAAFAALLIILLLRYSVGPMEMKGLGFEFKGSSGPIVLWIFCFLAIVSGIKLLW